ncbi:MAG: MerR family transcriptional regulator [Gemmatimonadetes bacterium]|nr:MerR family transcriptional regulator [Gemmatimonadota bacterium]
MSDDIVQEFFSIGDVCQLTDLKPHVLRYWESQFRFLNPAKNRSGNRVYQRREVDLIHLVKHLLYTEKYTIDGARQKVDEHRKGGAIKVVAREALAVETLAELERELAHLSAVLDGSVAVPDAAPDAVLEVVLDAEPDAGSAT